MALKAGYKGVKKNVLTSLMSLLGSKVIKSIGNGLALSDAGELATDIDTDTMEYKDGKLASKAGSTFIVTDLIDSAVSVTGSFKLLDDFTDYDFIEFIISDNQAYVSSYFVDSDTLDDSTSTIGFSIWDYQFSSINRNMKMYKVASDELYLSEITSGISIIAIKGIKF